MFILNEKISYYRRICGITQSELAEKLGISSAAVSKWEQGTSCPDVALLPQLSDLLNVSIDELFGRHSSKEPVYDFVDSVPWNDDGKTRMALFKGKKLMRQNEYDFECGTHRFSFRFDGVVTVSGVCKYTAATADKKLIEP